LVSPERVRDVLDSLRPEDPERTDESRNDMRAGSSRESATRLPRLRAPGTFERDTAPILDRLREPYIAGRDLGHAYWLVDQLAELLNRFRDTAPQNQPESQFLAVSLNADALERARAFWQGSFAEA